MTRETLAEAHRWAREAVEALDIAARGSGEESAHPVRGHHRRAVQTMDPMTKLRLAIVGAGPAGIYAADILLKAERKFDVSIDLFEQLPAPYGLVRYGVAPDHPRIKGIITALREVLDRGDIRLFGNVRFGDDITLDDLKRHYNAVIFATGAVHDAALDIPGIELAGSYGAADFVSWYDGHPDVPRDWPLDAQAGRGHRQRQRRARRVARMLAKHAEDLLPPRCRRQRRTRVLEASPVTDVHVFGRRGPMQVQVHPARAARARRAARRRHGRLRRGLRLRRRPPSWRSRRNKQVLVIDRC